MSALEIRAFRNLAYKLVKIQERGKLMGNLISAGIGLREVEEFVRHEVNKLKGSYHKEGNQQMNRNNYIFKNTREIVAKTMAMKQKDNIKMGRGTTRARNKLKGKIEEKLGPRSRQCRSIMKSVNENCKKLRDKLKTKNTKKCEFLKGKYGMKENCLDELNTVDAKKYGMARIFKDGNGMKGVNDMEPTIVYMKNEEPIELTNDEKSVLALGPKFCIMNNLNEETFEREIEETIIKYRWEMKKLENEEKKNAKFGLDTLAAINDIFDEDELA